MESEKSADVSEKYITSIYRVEGYEKQETILKEAAIQRFGILIANWTRPPLYMFFCKCTLRHVLHTKDMRTNVAALSAFPAHYSYTFSGYLLIIDNFIFVFQPPDTKCE
jgi:hypothetical protein